MLVLVALLLPVGRARAERQDARKHYDQATAAFGLGRYADAAAEYEAAFRLRPDPALLYNCAQSYRLAGNKVRAVELYRNYVRLYGDAPNADDARKHVADLELQIAVSGSAGAMPAPGGSPGPAAPAAPLSGAVTTGVAPGPVPRTAAPTAAAVPRATLPAVTAAPVPVAPPAFVPPPSMPSPNVDLAAAPLPSAGADQQRPLWHRPWLWAAVGAVVVGGTVAILLATRSEKDPPATLGTIVGN